MVLEATMICIDNSEWMRNSDYAPTRFQAQADAVNLICGAKTQSNPENTVGLLTMAGKRVRVLVTPTSDLGKILACMHGLEIGGELNLASGIQVAQLALKHRQNKNQQQRIIVFAGSPTKHEKKLLETIGRKLKKNSVALDVVDFGESDDGNSEKLGALVAAVNNNGNSHIVNIPSGPAALSDALLSTPVFTGDGDKGSGFTAATAGGTSGYEFGVDPNIDPELALALRVSMEEERARQEAAAKKAAEDAAKQEKDGHLASGSEHATMAEPISTSTVPVTDDKRHDLMRDYFLRSQALFQPFFGRDEQTPVQQAINQFEDLSTHLWKTLYFAEDDENAIPTEHASTHVHVDPSPSTYSIPVQSAGAAGLAGASGQTAFPASSLFTSYTAWMTPGAGHSTAPSVATTTPYDYHYSSHSLHTTAEEEKEHSQDAVHEHHHLCDRPRQAPDHYTPGSGAIPPRHRRRRQ